MPNDRVRIFIDADMLFAASSSPQQYSASIITLRLSELTFVNAFTTVQVIEEVDRNLRAKAPQAIPMFHLLVSVCLEVIPNPDETEIALHEGKADPKDLPILVAAAQHKCPILITFNVRHFRPGLPAVEILRPGEFVQRVRSNLLTM